MRKARSVPRSFSEGRWMTFRRCFTCLLQSQEDSPLPQGPDSYFHCHGHQLPEKSNWTPSGLECNWPRLICCPDQGKQRLSGLHVFKTVCSGIVPGDNCGYKAAGLVQRPEPLIPTTIKRPTWYSIKTTKLLEPNGLRGSKSHHATYQLYVFGQVIYQSGPQFHRL